MRHTDNDGDKLTSKGIAAAEAIGRERLTPPSALFGSTGARATEMVEILRRIVGQDDVPVTVVGGLRSLVEDPWRTAAKAAGKDADVEAIRTMDPDLVERETLLLGSALRGVFDAMPAGGRALVVGHSPTNEAAVLGLATDVVGPLGAGEGVLIIEDGGRFCRRDGTRFDMTDRKGEEGYHNPFAGHRWCGSRSQRADPADRARHVRAVGLLSRRGCSLDRRGSGRLPLIAALFALVAVVDLAVVIRRKLHGEPG